MVSWGQWLSMTTQTCIAAQANLHASPPVSLAQTLHHLSPVQTPHPVSPVQTLHHLSPVQTLHPVSPVQTPHPVFLAQTQHPALDIVSVRCAERPAKLPSFGRYSLDLKPNPTMCSLAHGTNKGSG